MGVVPMREFLTSIFLLMVFGCSRERVAVTTPQSEGAAVGTTPLAKALKEAEAYYAPHLPRLADDETRLEKVRATGKELRFECTLIHTLKSELDLNAVESLLQRELESEARRSERLNSLLKQGATIVYSYKDKAGEPVTEIRIVPESVAERAIFPEDALSSAKAVYREYVQRSVNFDAGIANLYSEMPKSA